MFVFLIFIFNELMLVEVQQFCFSPTIIMYIIIIAKTQHKNSQSGINITY